MTPSISCRLNASKVAARSSTVRVLDIVLSISWTRTDPPARNGRWSGHASRNYLGGLLPCAPRKPLCQSAAPRPRVMPGSDPLQRYAKPGGADMARVQIDYIQLRPDNSSMLCMKISEESFFIDRGRPASLQAQIREAIVSGILSQRMLPGARLPSTRRLAEHLGVSRITVTNAYQELVSQGYLTTRDRSAYLVTESPPISRPQIAPYTGTPGHVDWNATTDPTHLPELLVA